MRISRAHSPWAIFVVLTSAAAGLLYVANFHPERLPVAVRLPAFFGETPPTRHTVGGTPLGLIFGSIAFAIFLFAAALGIRKKQRLWPIGSVQFWLKAHIWLTILTIPLVLFHGGFRLGGTHTTALMILYSVVMGSGFFGLALQQFMPRLMKERLPREVVFEQIPRLRAGLLASAEKVRDALREVEREETALAGDASRPGAGAGALAIGEPSVALLIHFLEEECLRHLSGERVLSLGDDRVADDRFRTLKLNLPRQWHATVEELQHWCRERRQMDLQTRLQHWLHGWLLIHVPTSFALLVLTAWHAWAAVRYLVAS